VTVLFTTLNVLHWVAIILCISYSWTSPFIKHHPESKAATFASEIRPFAWFLAAFVAVHGGLVWTAQDVAEDGWSAAGLFMGAVLFFLWAWLSTVFYKEWKNSDDDRWKKRRKKLKAKVKEVGGKLVVEPEPEMVRVTA